jgi:mono/diheme cytochrome c family protein
LVKIGLLMPLLGVAGLNAFILKPRFVAAIDTLYQQGGTPSDATRAHWTPQLRKLRELLVPTVAAEIVLVVAVFGAVGVLTQTATAEGQLESQAAGKAPAAKFEQKATSGGINYDLVVTPNKVGLNDYELNITTPDGKPATTVTLARLRFNYTDAPNAVAPSEIVLNRLTPGDYKGAGSYFTTPGNWRIDMTIQRSDADDVSHAFVLPVAPAPPSLAAAKHSAFALPFTVFNWNEVTGAVLAFLGALVLIYRRQINLGNLGYRATVTGATCVLLAGAVLAFGVHSHSTPAVNPTKGNPVASNAASVARGKELFQQNCVMCHGIDGRGDGPQAASLSPAPTDFRFHMPLHTDPQFYAFIHDGYQGTAMPAFGKAFSPTDIWNLVNYLRSAFSGTPSQ